MIRFSKANSKIKKLAKRSEFAEFLRNKRKIYSFDMLSGHNCPFAKDCLSRVIINPEGKRRIEDGKHTQFRCFSASQEVVFPAVYDLRKHNADLMRSCTSKAEMLILLRLALPDDAGIVRIHVAGDFFNQKYFDAWIALAAENPDRLFYAYTKSLPYWVKRLGDIPDNMILTASRGGRKDDLIDEHNLRYAKVIGAVDEADGLEIDEDDSHAANPLKGSFALLIHGPQPAGSDASKALQLLKAK